jgi:cytochrome c biogenesis protein
MSVTTSGIEITSGHRPMRRVIELMSSMRFAISAAGGSGDREHHRHRPHPGRSRIPNYVNQFGPFWADIFRSLSLYTVYSAWWFMLILGFLDGFGFALRDPQCARR